MSAVFLKGEDGYAEAEAFEHLVQGEGHFIGFGTGLHASTGLNPMPGYAAITWNGAAWYGNQPGYIITSSSTVLQYDAQLGRDWSVLFREGGVSPVWAGGATFNSAGRASYNGGSYTYGIGDWAQGNDHDVSVIDGVVTFRGTSNSHLDDVVILPWVITDEMADLWSTPNLANGEPVWGPLPVLRVTGDLIAESHSYMVGEVTGVKYVGKGRVGGNVSSMWVNNAKIVDFTLTEVSDTFVRADVL